MDTITVLDRERLAAHLPDLLALATAAFTAPPWNETPAQAAGAAIRLITDAAHDDHLAVMASLDEQPCGFAYAVSARHLEQLAAPASVSVSVPFELRELAVDPRYRGRGIGVGMHDALIAARPGRPRYLATHPAARPALALYRARGWRSTTLITHDGIGPRILMHRPH